MATQTRVPTGNGDQETSYYSKTPSGDDYFECVDDPIGAPDDDTSMLSSSSTASHYMLFTFAPFEIPANSAIPRVTIYLRHKNQTATYTAENRSALKVGATRYLTTQSAITLTDATWQDDHQDWTTNPATAAAWTADEVNALAQFGFYGRRVTGNLYDTQVYAEAEYYPPVYSASMGWLL